MPVPKAAPLLPSKPLAIPPALFNPNFLSNNAVAAPSLMAPLIRNPLNLPMDLPNLVPKSKYAVKSFGPRSEKNLIVDAIFSLFFGSVTKEMSLIKNYPPTIDISA